MQWNSSTFICAYDVDDGVSFLFHISLCHFTNSIYYNIVLSTPRQLPGPPTSHDDSLVRRSHHSRPLSTTTTANESQWLVGELSSSSLPFIDHQDHQRVTMTRWCVVLILSASRRPPRPPTSDNQHTRFQKLAPQSWSQTHISEHHNTFIWYRTRFRPSVAIRTHYRPLSRVSDLQAPAHISIK
jgi:hypothetical protein